MSVMLEYLDNQIEHMLDNEDMPNGSLSTHLFDSSQPLSWSVRIKIAIGAAQDVAFLHTTAEALIYRDIKSANILLDEEFNAKLSDFGLLDRKWNPRRWIYSSRVYKLRSYIPEQ